MNIFALINQGECWECSGSTEILGVYVDDATAQLARQAVLEDSTRSHGRLKIVELPVQSFLPVSDFPVGYTFEWRTELSCCCEFNPERSELVSILGGLENLDDSGLNAIDSDELNVSFSEGKKEFRFESTVVSHRLRLGAGGRFVNACMLVTRVV